MLGDRPVAVKRVILSDDERTDFEITPTMRPPFVLQPNTTFDVTVAPGEAPALRRVHDDPAEAARWSMRDLSPAPGFVGALLVEGHGWSLERLEAVP